ncbi:MULTISPECIES: phosphoribosyltransferase [Comamonas]|uniref:Phosphoribosyl transferase n=1 Tax=Comamonas thiooxydans TaxID=363952 RepID=A0A0E3BD05_9BURK|nr:MULTISPECIES: phosphoribosyltransferase [Comamonas]KGG89390.1 phosphoribosyl transferase [Comamonas thiooxydans]CUB02111.1 Predicted phosphoribosyltransferase [Comamonas thiooxydans]
MRPDTSFRDRADAGRALAAALAAWREQADVLVLALPRGGVPVAYEVASALALRLDLMLVRKLGTPGHKEMAMGAIASGGVRVLNDDLIRGLYISPAAIDAVAQQEVLELRRRDLAYRGKRPAPAVTGQRVILVDDGLATGATMRAAIAAVRLQSPAHIAVAVPVAPVETLAMLRPLVDQLICLLTPAPFFSVGQWYRDFAQTTDEEVKTLLSKAWRRELRDAAQ